MDYLRRTPQVRDVVVSGGDVANMPWPRLEAWLTGLLEVENIRDIRLATKALMGLPQHWLQDDVVSGMERVSAIARSRGVSIAIHTHVNHANSVTPLVAQRGPDDAGHRHPRRTQPGRHPQRRQRRPAHPARPLLRAARWRADHAVLLLHVRHDPVLGALADLGRRRPEAPARDHGLPARVRHPADRLRRPVRRQAVDPPARRLRHRARHLATGPRTTAPPSRPPTPRRCRGPTSTTTRSTPSPPPARSGGSSTATSTSPTSRPPRSPRPPAVPPPSRPTEGRRRAVVIPGRPGITDVRCRCNQHERSGTTPKYASTRLSTGRPIARFVVPALGDPYRMTMQGAGRLSTASCGCDGTPWRRATRDKAIAKRVRTREWHRVRRGAYVSGELWDHCRPRTGTGSSAGRCS